MPSIGFAIVTVVALLAGAKGSARTRAWMLTLWLLYALSIGAYSWGGLL